MEFLSRLLLPLWNRWMVRVVRLHEFREGFVCRLLNHIQFQLLMLRQYLLLHWQCKCLLFFPCKRKLHCKFLWCLFPAYDQILHPYQPKFAIQVQCVQPHVPSRYLLQHDEKNHLHNFRCTYAPEGKALISLIAQEIHQFYWLVFLLILLNPVA